MFSRDYEPGSPAHQFWLIDNARKLVESARHFRETRPPKICVGGGIRDIGPKKADD